MLDTEVKASLKILQDIIEKKNLVLNEIYNITVNQNTVICAKQMDMDMFYSMVEEKRTRINDINNYDEKFQKIYDTIKKEVLKSKEKYLDNIKKLKNYIEEDMNLKMRIKLQEEKNKQILEKSFR